MVSDSRSPSSAHALSDLPRGVLLHADKEMHELTKLLIKKHLFSFAETLCLSPLGQMSYTQINPKCQEKWMIVSLASGPLQEKRMRLIKCAVPPKETSSVNWHLLQNITEQSTKTTTTTKT